MIYNLSDNIKKAKKALSEINVDVYDIDAVAVALKDELNVSYHKGG